MQVLTSDQLSSGDFLFTLGFFMDLNFRVFDNSTVKYP